MSDAKPPAKGTDWTHLLADPDLVTHLSELLRTYRDALPECREQALLETMRKIKAGRADATDSSQPALTATDEPSGPIDTSPSVSPPFETGMLPHLSDRDRRRDQRTKCFVAVEVRAAGSEQPSWGTLANISLGGCFVEVPASFESGSKITIGLWVAGGPIWVKGLIVNGVVTGTGSSCGIRIKFAALDSAEQETLRHFLKLVEACTEDYAFEHGYIAQLKP
jgi:hypothetical protein